MPKRCIVVAGPTAVGKTAIAIQLAQYFSTEIISADSRQCYRELNIGVARPSETELNAAPHHFIANHSIQENITAADFANFALAKVQDLFRVHDHVIMVGGTGLYIKAFCEGLDQIPQVPEEIRAQITQHYEEKGISWLQDELMKLDPIFAKEGEMHNPQRMMRALEIVHHTGKSIRSFQSKNTAQRNFEIEYVGLEMPRELLYERINSRVDVMMMEGLFKEVQSLHEYKHLNALQTVGYRELFDYLDGYSSFENAVELIKQNTRHYAKRQMTWFKKVVGMRWFENNSSQELLKINILRELGYIS